MVLAVLAAGAAALATAVPATAEAARDDVVLATTVDGVDVRIMIPAEAKAVRGAIVHAANYRMDPHDRWAETCRAMQFAHVALNMDLKRTNRPVILRKALDAGLTEFAGKSGHPELVNAPLAGTGHSAGGLVTATLLKTPERTITNTVSCGWIMDPAKLAPDAAAVPAAFTLGAIPDAFKMLPDIEAKFEPARRKGLPWALAVQWGCAHDYANSATFFIPWIQAVAELRLPKDWDPQKGPPRLRDVKQEDGWLGDRASVEGNWARIAAWDDYKGDKSLATWLPSAYVACIWRAMMSKDPPAVIEAAGTDGRAKLPPADPKGERGMMLDPGVDLLLGVTVREGTSVAKVEFFDGDRLLGAAARPPWQLTWKAQGIAQGPHALYAVWTSRAPEPGVQPSATLPEGSRGTTSPALVVRRGRAVGQPASGPAPAEDERRRP